MLNIVEASMLNIVEASMLSWVFFKFIRQLLSRTQIYFKPHSCGMFEQRYCNEKLHISY